MRSEFKARSRNRFRVRSLAHAATVGGALSALPSSEGEAAIVSDTSSTWNVGDSFFLDGTSLTELTLASSSGMGMLDLSLEAPTGMDGDSLIEIAIFSSGGMMAVEWLDALVVGDTVDGSLTFADEAFLVEDNDVNSEFPAGTTAYAGFVIDPDGILPMYGWARLSLDVSGTSFSLDQWAYDDSGAAMSVGVVPEPSTALLLGFGLAALAATRCGARIAPWGSAAGDSS